MQIEQAEFKPSELDLSSVPHGWSLITEAEQSMLFDFLAPTNPESWKPYLRHIEGRNAFFSRHAPTDGLYSHLQLSGGFYQEFTLLKESLSKPGNGLRRVSADNFVPGREAMFTTAAVTESGEITHTALDYVPAGGYTEWQMTKKAFDTLSLGSLLAELDTKGSPHVSRFAVPRVVGVYRFPDVRGPEDNPLYGLAMLTHAPEQGFTQTVTEFFERYGKHYKSTIVQRIVKTYGPRLRLLGGAIRTLHDQFGLYHRQLTGGNCAIITMPDGTLMPFISDWHTTKRLPEQKSANVLARVIDIFMPWESLSRLMSHLAETNVTNRDNAGYFATVVLSALIRGYMRIGGRQVAHYEQAFWAMVDDPAFEGECLQRMARFLTQLQPDIGSEEC